MPTGSSKFASFFVFRKLVRQAVNVTYCISEYDLFLQVGQPGASPRLPHVKKTHLICINLTNHLWQKWGWHVQSYSPHGDALVDLLVKKDHILKCKTAVQSAREMHTIDTVYGQEELMLKLFKTRHVDGPNISMLLISLPLRPQVL